MKKIIPLHVFNSSAMYEDTLADLRAIIESEYNSVAAFCASHGIDRFNLSKCWPEEGKKPKDMSVGLYLRICIGLGILSADAVAKDQLNYSLSLRDYIVIDNNAVMKSLLLINKL